MIASVKWRVIKNACHHFSGRSTVSQSLSFNSSNIGIHSMVNRLTLLLRHRPVAILLTLYTVVVIIGLWHHEIWRDEMRALNLVIESPSVWHILTNKQAEGHPAVWYVLLYYGYHLIGKPQILKITSLLVAFSAMYLFLKWSTLTWIQRVLFVFGYFPLYEYAVISRNYGISLVFLFGICCFYPRRHDRMLPIGCLLFLLIHTNAYATVIAISMLLSLFIETIVYPSRYFNTHIRSTGTILGFAVALLGLVLFVLYMHPFHQRAAGIIGASGVVDIDSIKNVSGGILGASRVVHVDSFKNKPGRNFDATGVDDIDSVKNLLRPIIFPGYYYAKAMGFSKIVFASVVIWSFFLNFLRKPFVFLFFFLSVTGMGLFHECFNAPMYLRHEGMIIVLIVASFWLYGIENINTTEKNDIPKNLGSRFSIHMRMLLSLLLIMQVCTAAVAITKEVFFSEYSTSKRMGKFIGNNPEWKDAIVIGEPDVNIQSLPYYVDNRFYIIRENRFGRYVDFKPNKLVLSLSELIQAAIELNLSSHKPILIAMGHDLNPDGPYKLNATYRKSFVYDLESLKEFHQLTRHLDSFHQGRFEKFDLYVLESLNRRENISQFLTLDPN